MNLLDLNEDCLIKIIKNLDIFTQITLTQVCSQIQKIIHSLWQHTYKVTTIDGFKRTCKYQNDAQFVTAFTHIGSFIVELKIQHLKARKIRLLSQISLDNCIQLTLIDWHHDFCDADIKLISKMFPRLEIFLPKCSYITGAYIDRYENLKHLDLSHCTAFRSKYLPVIFNKIQLQLFKMRFNGYDYQQLRQNAQYEQHICSILNCQTLQVLELDDLELAMLTSNSQLMLLRQLSNVRCYVRDFMAYILDDLACFCAFEIVEFITLEDNVTLQLLLCISRANFRNLKKLTIVNSHLMDLPLVLANSLLELNLIGCNLAQTILLHCIKNFKHLKQLNVTKSKGLNEQFLWDLLIILRQDIAIRNVLPLKLIIRNSSLEHNLLYHPDILRNSDVLVLSWEQQLINLDINHFEFTLRSTDCM